MVKKAGPKYYVEVDKPLSPHLEVGVIQHKLYKIDRNPVIYCPKITGSKLPLITNLFGSFELLGVALGMEPSRIDQGAILHEYRKREGSSSRPGRSPLPKPRSRKWFSSARTLILVSYPSLTTRPSIQRNSLRWAIWYAGTPIQGYATLACIAMRSRGKRSWAPCSCPTITPA